MSPTSEDPVVGGLLEELAKTLEEQDAPDPELEALREDVRALGYFGLLVAMSDAPAPTEEVRAELPAKIIERIRQQLGAEAEGRLLSLAEAVAAYRAAKGAKVLRKLIENAIYDFYDLKEHGLFVDDVGRILDIFRASAGATDDIKMFVKGLAALSSETAKFMVGLFPEQINLIYKITRREAEKKEIDDAFDSFGPRAMWKRIFAITKTLIPKEKRFRLALTLWARLSGVPITREQILDLEKHLAVKDTKDLVKRAVERKEARRALVEFRKAHAAEIGAIEAAL